MDFPKDEQEIKTFRATLSEARFARYLAASNGREGDALALYVWNAKISQAFYLPIQIWEICLRNQMNRFLCWKYGGAWPYDEQRAVRQLQGKDKEKLIESRERQARNRGLPQATTDSIAADLTAGFWVGLLAHRYAQHLQWRLNLPKVFPNAPPDWRLKPTGWDPTTAHAYCGEILALRNRVAHHEPIFEMELADLHFKMAALVGAMCTASFSYLTAHCSVQETLLLRPIDA